MTVSVSAQMLLFCLSLALGGAFGLVYDLLYGFRRLFPCGRAPAFAADCLYLLLCGAATFLFLLIGNAGEVRLFVLAGEALGFVIYRFTLGVLVSRAVKAAAAQTRRAAFAAGRCLKRPASAAERKMGAFAVRTAGRIRKTASKGRKVAKTGLKPARLMMYNLSYRVRRGAAKKTARRRTGHHGAGK